MRNQLLLDFSQKYKLELKKLKIEKIQNGVPRLFYDGKDLGLVISLTHCGVFGGFSYCPEIPNKR
ncbi:hypothetical protein CW751_14390 [Brumimicrobium salinarum]|uniref:Uncharacterized protein n=1 Tax=Brumimicrobium salinarum TaxID=2058658 RepID=A0A2I0QZ46_9FLAO|nr:hypothetical protein [Brumimicrobium salinarum]PKR79603.1 hypothetical protein CW751_14390 [Brumimicrobium salinarum]